MRYDKKNVSLLSDTIPIKLVPEGKKGLRSLIAINIKESDCSDIWTFFAHHCENGSSQIQAIGFDQSYCPVAHYESFRINISITAMHRLTSRVFNFGNVFQNTNVPIHGIVCVSPQHNYLDPFERYYPNVPLS